MIPVEGHRAMLLENKTFTLERMVLKSVKDLFQILCLQWLLVDIGNEMHWAVFPNSGCRSGCHDFCRG